MQPKIRTFRDKVRDAIRAFRGKEIGYLTFGVDVKQCKDCEYKHLYDECFVLNDCNKELMNSLADKFDRVNPISPEELRKALERTEKVDRGVD